MGLEHGSLENAILNAMWKLNEIGEVQSPVSEVYKMIKISSQPRAYTTLKTVMDRLYAKGILTRIKLGKKFYYKVAQSREEMFHAEVEKIAQRFFNSDMHKMARAVEIVCEKYHATV